ncbi:fimbrial protein [Dyella japonica]|uniref:fimbrial protein n=1 Tax=Dyella japonica TaxID=231455 RepID=UPI000368E515|nr:fimbrial protein [Dyella japonica]
MTGGNNQRRPWARLSALWLLMLLAFVGWAPSALAAAPACSASSATLTMPSSVTVQPFAGAGPISGATGTATITFNCSGLPASKSSPDYTATIQAGQFLAPLDATNNTNGPGITFATNITGLAVLVTASTVQATSNSCLACGPTSTAGYVPGSIVAPSNSKVNAYSGSFSAVYTAQLIKTTSGAVSPGTITTNQLIPFWWYIPGGSVDSVSQALNAYLILPNITITVPTCTISAGANQTVTLPTVDSRLLATSGATAGLTPFSISITNCPAGASIATNVFSGGSTDSTTGALTNTTSSAKGGSGAANLEVQFLNGPGGSNNAGSLINLSQTTASAQGTSTYTLVNNGATLNYYAQYLATGAVTPGLFTATVQYGITYQ